MNKQKGFTIIELIVVIAIIAVLASIVLVNVTQYINKSKDANIKGNLGTIQTQASALAADANNSITAATLNANATISAAETQIASYNGGTAVSIISNGTGDWCIQSPLVTDTANSPWCVDSTGYSGKVGSSKCESSSYSCK